MTGRLPAARFCEVAHYVARPSYLGIGAVGRVECLVATSHAASGPNETKPQPTGLADPNLTPPTIRTDRKPQPTELAGVGGLGLSNPPGTGWISLMLKWLPRIAYQRFLGLPLRISPREDTARMPSLSSASAATPLSLSGKIKRDDEEKKKRKPKARKATRREDRRRRKEHV